MRALVISDSHFGAWTGEDLLRQPDMLALLEPHLDVDEVIFLGDMFDFLFAEVKDGLAASTASSSDDSKASRSRFATRPIPSGTPVHARALS